MHINSVVANSISDMAESLGLPESNKNSLISAIIGNSYDLSVGTFASQIWDAFSMEPADISKNTVSECIKLIDNFILPPIYNYIDSKLNSSLFPSFSYPLELSLLIDSFPNISSVSLENVLYGWGLCRDFVAKYMALSELFLLADNVEPTYLAKSREYLSRSKDLLECLILNIERTSNMIPPDLGGGSSNSGLKVLTVRLRKSSNINTNEFGY